MTFHVFFFFLLSFLLLTLAWLGRLCLLHHSHPHWQAGAVLATCGIRRSELACENVSCCLLLLAYSPS